MTSGFSRMLPSTIPSGPDIGISLHAVIQRSKWPATKAVKSHITFSHKERRKNCMWANAQRDGRLAEYRWRPLVNAAKFG